MENLFRLIQSFNNMYLMPELDIERLLPEFSERYFGREGGAYASESVLSPYISKSIENAEYVTQNLKSIMLSNINNIDSRGSMPQEKIYENTNFTDNKVIHQNNTSQSGSYSDLRSFLGDNSENFEDNNYYSAEKNNFIHNKKEFKEIYDYAESLVNGGDSIENNSSTSSVSINLGGVTQNITEANCDKVLEELGDMLLRALSGCEGIY